METKTSNTAVRRAADDYDMDSKSSMKGTDADAHDMQVMGKTQQLNVGDL